MAKVWNIKEYDEEVVLEYCKRYNISKVLAILLINRNISIDDAEKYLNISLDDLYDPFLMKDMDILVDRVLKAKENNEKIMIYGDYDVDGVTSITVLYSFLKEIGIDADYYLPDRMEEGYGLNKDALKHIKDSGYSLVITVDCGISAIEELDYAKEIGLEVCITDHHECGQKLPNALAVVNPKREDCNYSYTMLAGVGVAFKVITALSIKLGLDKEFYLKYIDIVAVGTIADIVPLLDENRIIAKIGIEKIKTTKNEGLKALIRVAGIKNIDSTSISFGIAPRINASGRMADAKVAVKLLLSTNPMEANSLAELLDSQNKERQMVEKKILEEVVEKIEKEKLYNRKSLVIAGKGWHQGVIGIVASKVAEKYLKPVILITYEDSIAKGSGRTPYGISLYEALEKCKDVLIQFGGHELAAGVTLDKDKIEEFRDRFDAAILEIQKEDLEAVIDIDLEITKQDISTSEPLPNTLIEVYNENDELVYSGRTDNEGKITIEDLKYGKYYFIEKEAPEGYTLNNEKMYFEILEDGEIVKATMVDEKEVIEVPNTLANIDSIIIPIGIIKIDNIFNILTNEFITTELTSFFIFASFVILDT